MSQQVVTEMITPKSVAGQPQSMKMSAAQAELELLKLDEEIARREARASFLQYCRHPDLFPGESPAAHHEFMIDALQRVYRGEIKRLMV